MGRGLRDWALGIGIWMIGVSAWGQCILSETAVRVTDANGCTVTDSVRLEGMNKQCLIIPDAFSPNRDLVNDVWNIEHIDLYPAVEITIYNRWGQLLWESEPGYPVPWNGRSRGEDLPIDSYHYFIDLKNGTKPLVGDVTIVR